MVSVIHYKEVVKHSKKLSGRKQSFGNDYSRYSLETIIFAQPYNLKSLYSLVSVIRTVGGYAEKLPLHRVFSRFFSRARAPKEVIYVYIAVRKALEKPH